MKPMTLLFIKCYFTLRNTTEAKASHTDNLALTNIENSSPVKELRSSSVSQPIPVPTQVQNYEKMQESRDRAKSFGSAAACSPSGSPFDGTRKYI